MSAPATELRGLALLDAAIARIEEHPETWRQDSYRCSSGMCVAGWAAELAGGAWLSDDPDAGNGDELMPEPDDDPAHLYAGAVDAADRARRLLGLTGQQAEALFEGCNTLDDIRRIRNQIAAAVSA